MARLRRKERATIEMPFANGVLTVPADIGDELAERLLNASLNEGYVSAEAERAKASHPSSLSTELPWAFRWSPQYDGWVCTECTRVVKDRYHHVLRHLGRNDW